MDPKALQSLERGFWYRLGGGVLVGTVAAVALAFALVPEDPFLPALLGALAVVFLGFTATSLAVGSRVEAAGQGLAASGWVVLAAGAAVDWAVSGLAATLGVSDPIFWVGLGLVFVGGLVGFWADHRDSVRAANG